jgi:hypothetical protein
MSNFVVLVHVDLAAVRLTARQSIIWHFISPWDRQDIGAIVRTLRGSASSWLRVKTRLAAASGHHVDACRDIGAGRDRAWVDARPGV